MRISEDQAERLLQRALALLLYLPDEARGALVGYELRIEPSCYPGMRVWARCRPSRKLLLLTGPFCVHLSDKDLSTLLCHEAGHAVLFNRGEDWRDENEVNALVQRWGWDIPRLRRVTCEQYYRLCDRGAGLTASRRGSDG